jgi:hypothetical protein
MEQHGKGMGNGSLERSRELNNSRSESAFAFVEDQF